MIQTQAKLIHPGKTFPDSVHLSGSPGKLVCKVQEYTKNSNCHGSQHDQRERLSEQFVG